ncbi:MAG: ATP-dependent endonuclease, partial [Chloroflexi bacterium]
MVKIRAVVVVEGDSDRVALETLAKRRGRDLAAEGVEIVSIGGAHAIRRYLERLKAEGSDVTLAGLVDAGQEDVFRRAVDHTGFEIDLYVCDSDL